ncbi:MAG: hypothetical protein R3B93_07705 [Bacteroidia bacterium]
MKSSIKEKYEEKYDDIDYLNINANEDNDFGSDEDDGDDDDWD